MTNENLREWYSSAYKRGVEDYQAGFRRNPYAQSSSPEFKAWDLGWRETMFPNLRLQS